MIAGVSFEKAAAAIWDYPIKRGFYTSYADLKLGLSALGLKPAPRAVRATRFELIDRLSIVACRKRGDGSWHFIIWEPRTSRVFDPLKHAPVAADVGRLNRLYRPFSRLSVKR
jgi:hypothetical protein